MQTIKFISQYEPMPVRLFIIRHGESPANVDKKIYAREIDSQIPLTEKGWEQSLACGRFLKDFYEKSPSTSKGEIEAWLSPYTRTRQTFTGILEGVGVAANGLSLVNRVQEADCFAEIRRGVLDALGRTQTFPDEVKLELLHKQGNAKYFFRALGGESRSDVAMRCRSIFGAMNHSHRDNGVRDFWIICHQVTALCLANVWLGRRHEDLDEAGKPSNCSVRLIDTQRDYGYIYQDGKACDVLQPINVLRAQDYYTSGAYRPEFAKNTQKAITFEK
jgi:broad specificity phosphatase PhoE